MNGDQSPLSAMNNSKLINSVNFKYLPKRRFEAIYRMLSVAPSWEVIGEDLFGETITEQEVFFISKCTRGLD